MGPGTLAPPAERSGTASACCLLSKLARSELATLGSAEGAGAGAGDCPLLGGDGRWNGTRRVSAEGEGCDPVGGPLGLGTRSTNRWPGCPVTTARHRKKTHSGVSCKGMVPETGFT